MIEIEIISDKQLLKLNEKSDFSLDFKIQDIASITAIQSNVSTSFKIPVFNDYESLQINNQSNKPYTFIGCRLRVDGVYIFQNGTLTIEYVEGDEYLVTLYEGNVDFVTELDGLTFADLDLSALDHQWQLAEVTGSFSNTWSNGYIYPFIQYGAQGNSAWSGNARTEFLHPSIFIKYIIQEIFSQFSIYTPSGTAYSDALFENTVLPFSTTYRPVRDKQTRVGTEAVTNYTTAVLDSTRYKQAIYTASSEPVGFNEFGFIINATTSMYATATIDNTAGGASVTAGIFLISADNLTVTTLDSSVISAGGSASVSLSAIDTDVLAEEEVFFGLIVPSAFEDVNISVDDADFKFGFNYINEQVPKDIELIDFIKATFAMFGIISEVDNISNELVLHRFEELGDNKTSSLDWSDKIDFEQKFKLDYHATDYAQENFFEYKEIEQVPTTISRQSFTILDEALPAVKDWISIELSACEEVSVLEGNCVKIEKYVLRADTTDVYEATEDTQPRICYIESQVKSTTFTDGIDTFESSPDERIAGRFANLEFNNLLTTYYADFTSMFTKYKKITAYFRLSQLDIANLDFFKPIYLNVGQGGKMFLNGYFYINRINNFQANKSTEVEIIRIDPVRTFNNNVSLLFDGVNEYLEIGGLDRFSFIQNTATFTISFWAKFPTSSQDDFICANSGGITDRGIRIFKQSNDRVYLAIDDGSGVQNYRAYTRFLTFGGWNQYTFTMTNGGNGLLYVDGVDKTGLADTCATTSGDSSKELYIGSTSLPSVYGNFYINNLLIYDTYSTPAQVAALYNGGVPKDPSFTNLQLYLTMGNDPRDDINTIYDQTSNEWNATGNNLESEDFVEDVP